MNKYLLILLAAFSLFFHSCTEDSNTDKTSLNSGTLIVNEGQFGTGTGTISYFDGKTLIEDIYADNNVGLVLGNIAQSVIKFDNKFFIAVNNAAKVVVVNAADFKHLGEIEVKLPRYFAVANNKLYLTSWSEDFTSGFVNLIDTKDLKIVKSVPVQGLVEKMVAQSNQLYITVSASAFDQYKNDVVVFDTDKNEVTGSIKVGDNSNDITTDSNDDIWVICSGFYDFSNPANNTAGSLHRIRGNSSDFSIELPNGSSKLVSGQNKASLYYLSDGAVRKFNIADLATDPLFKIEGFFYSLGYDETSDLIYLGDAKDFQQKGTVSTYKANNTQSAVNTLTTGIAPSFFYFIK